MLLLLKEESKETETEHNKNAEQTTLQIEQSENTQMQTVLSNKSLVEDANKAVQTNISGNFENDFHKLELNLTCNRSNKNKGRVLYERNKRTDLFITDWEKKSLLMENKDFLRSSTKRTPKTNVLNQLFKGDQRSQSYSVTLDQQKTKTQPREIKQLSQTKSPKIMLDGKDLEEQKRLKEEEQDREFRRRTYGTFNQKNLLDFHTKVQIIKNLRTYPLCSEKKQAKVDVTKQLSTNRRTRKEEQEQLSEYSVSIEKNSQLLEDNQQISSKTINRGSLSLPATQKGDNRSLVQRNDKNPCYFLKQKYPDALRPRRKEEIDSSMSSFMQSNRSFSSSISVDKGIENASFGSRSPAQYKKKILLNQLNNNSSYDIEISDNQEAGKLSALDIQNNGCSSSRKCTPKQKQLNQTVTLKLSPDLNAKQASTYQQLNGFMLDMIQLKNDVHRLQKERIHMRKKIQKVTGSSQLPSDNYSVKDFISFVQSYNQYA